MPSIKFAVIKRVLMTCTGSGHIIALSLVCSVAVVVGIGPLFVSGGEVGGNIKLKLLAPVGIIAFS